MKIFLKFPKSFSTTIREIPSVPSPNGILGKYTGNFIELYNLSKKNQYNIGMALHSKSEEYYRQLDSKTLIVNILGTKNILCADPEVYKEILGQKQDSFTNSIEFAQIVNEFFKNSMIAVQNDQWVRIRKVTQRGINKKSLDDLVPIVCDTTEKFYSNSNINKIDTIEFLMRVTFDSFHKFMYGWDPQSVLFDKDSSDILENCNIISDAIGHRFLSPTRLLWYLPTKENRRIKLSVENLKQFIKKFIDKYKKILKKNINNENYNKSLLDELIIASESGEEGGMTNEELVDQIGTLFFGAYDTTSNTLNFCLNYLARYKEVQNKLREEILKKFTKGKKRIHNSKSSEFEDIEYLGNFIDEVQRLNGIVPFLQRDCIRDVTINNFEIKKGTRILIDSRTIGHDPKFWNDQTDLDKFRPERWQEYKPPILKRPMPFGFGGRICIGRKIALAEIKIFLTSILSDYQVSLRNPDEKLEMDFFIGKNIKQGNGNVNFIKI